MAELDQDVLQLICQECQDDEAMKYCEDCVSESQYYCNDCADNHLKKKANANHRVKGIGEKSPDENGAIPFEEFLNILGFSKYFFDNERLSLNDALLICNKNYNVTDTFQSEELLSLILQKIMARSYHCRNVFLRKKTGQKPFPIIYHPMDSLLAVLLCCDNILLQDVYSRMYACQIAIPLLLPNPHTKQITFPLWAMRGIVKQWKQRSSTAASAEYTPCEGRLVDCPLPIVSFMRLSKVKNLYKSKILNGVISNSKHQYFFDSECPGSDTKRRYVDGLVEIAWYLPQGRENDLFSSPISFCNLRGDSQNHLAQFKFLMAISKVCFLFVKNEDIASDTNLMKRLSQFCHIQKKVYLLMNICQPNLKERIPSNCSILTLKGMGLPAVIETIRHKINESLIPRLQADDALSTISFSSAIASSENKIRVDEIHDPFISSGKENAAKIMKLIRDRKKNASMVKGEVVPLQGAKYWQKWAKENKKQKRKQIADMGEMNESNFFSAQAELKNSIMKDMLKTGYSGAMQIFIDTLLKVPNISRVYFLHWLRLQLDDYSREVLPELHAKCHSTRAKLAKIENSKENKQATQELKERLNEENRELTNASFGLEHFFREMGVIYEIVNGKDNPMLPAWSSQVQNFPKIAAELLADTGHALELLDGDAAHISVNWVTAILQELKKKIGKNSKLFILSVLGIQSSGKSTLLNTAFGLQFAVSAGRCTRGAYFQLLKCDKASFKGACDYVLVIDTEGLRAPELDYQQTQKHDNELATLVIGLASVTIVNVFGEVSGEMDDILQTTVHAFLRMKEADLRPSCLLVKHHVDEVTANKGMDGLLKLQDKLDEMAMTAAQQEHCEGLYKKFRDVIQFDVEKDVQYFPNLWAGCPPMSPVDPKYSEAAQNLKMKVIDTILAEKQQESGTSVMCTLGEFQLRITDLWNSVLQENFIFSFKNTLEIAAFNELDQLSAKWSWSIENCVQDWESETRTLIKGGKLMETDANDGKRIKKVEVELDREGKQIKKVEEELDKVHESIQQEINELFEKHEFACALAHMRSTTEAKFRRFVEDHKQNASKFCKENVDREKLNLKVKNETEYHEKIQQAVKDLVVLMKVAKDTKITVRQLEEQFSIEWEGWMRDIEKDASPLHNIDIQEEILQAIFTYCGIQHLHALIRDDDGVKSRSLSKTAYLYMDVDKEKHINEIWSIGSMIKKLAIWNNDHQQKYDTIKKRTAVILKEEKQFLDDTCQAGANASIRSIITGSIIKIVTRLQREINELEKEVNQYFTFTAQFRVDVILATCGYAIRVFEILQKESYNSHPITYFKLKRDMYCRNFVSQCCQGVNAIQTAITKANSLADLVMASVKSQLHERMIVTLRKKECERMIFLTKKSLKREVLLRLLKERNFNLYATHLENIEQSYLYWISKFVQEHCAEITEDGKTLIVTIAANELKSMESAVEYAVKKYYKLPASQHNKDWLNAFHQELTCLPILQQDLMKFVFCENIELERFKTEFLVKFKQQFSEFFSEVCHNQSIFYEVRRIVSKQIHEKQAGCCAQCPFCKEQCEMTEPDHITKHMCSIHRPQCLGSRRWKSSQEMVLTVCNDDIRGTNSFYSNEAKEFVPFKDYQKYFKDWFIDEDRCHTPRYWQWFIGEYTTQLANHFRMKEPCKEQDIITDWKDFSADDAESDVEEKYNKYKE